MDFKEKIGNYILIIIGAILAIFLANLILDMLGIIEPAKSFYMGWCGACGYFITRDVINGKFNLKK